MIRITAIGSPNQTLETHRRPGSMLGVKLDGAFTLSLAFAAAITQLLVR